MHNIGTLMIDAGGSVMWLSWWILEREFGMGAYTGKVVGALRPRKKLM